MKAQMEVPESAPEILLRYLKDLVKKEFKAFKFHLKCYKVKEGYKLIPESCLEKADHMYIASALISSYQEEYAFKITGDLLHKINRNDLLEKFKVDTKTYFNNNLGQLKTSIQDNRKKYKDFIVKKFSVMKENASLMGEYIDLKERYTRLLIRKYHRDQEQREHEIMSTGRKHQEIFSQRAESSYTRIADLFEPDERGHTPQIVVLQGAAGIGKTMTARKIMLDWASGELFQAKFNYVFYISCREVNKFPFEPTIADLLLHSCPEMSRHNIENELEKLLFIVDGFDELKLPTDFQINVPAKTSIMDNTILSLISKTCILPSYVLITTRPTALHLLKQWVEVPRLAEILGFSCEDRKEYFIKFFGDVEQGTLALNIVAENDILSTMCFIPIVCWIVCTVLKEGLKKTENSVFVLKSTTSLYLTFLTNLLKQHGSVEAKANINRHLKNLCALANEGVFEQKILFEESDLIDHGLDIEDIQSLFLKNDIFIKDAEEEKLYSFIHLSFQEFFAALYYILEGNGEEDPQKNVMGLLEAYRKPGQNHLMLTVRFLFGLLNAEIMRKMQKSYKWKISADIKLSLKEWATKEIGNSIENKQMDLLYCLFESQDEQFAKEAVQNLNRVYLILQDTNGFNPMDGKVVTYCMKNAPAVQSFYLNGCVLSSDIFKMIPSCLRKCSRLTLSGCSLTASCCEDLSCLLRRNKSLKELRLSGNKLDDSGVRQLCEVLKQPSCKLETLRLSGCSLTASCCADLSGLLQANASLKELHLTGNKLKSSGVRHLCEGLKQPSCKLETLKLSSCSITASCCADLSCVVRTNTFLKELVLSWNKLKESGVRQLCEGLKQPICKLKSLDLSGCSITASCCADISCILTNTSLKELDLRVNKLEDSGVRQLCEGLKQTSCKLETLKLSSCSITASCCADLSCLLRTNTSLKELDLSVNKLEDSGVRQLCEGLKQPRCNLNSLDLRCSCLADGCAEALCSVLRKNTTLQSLNLESNNFTDGCAEALCSALRENTTLQTLNLELNNFTDDCAEALCSALRENTTLQSLKLRWNHFTPQAFKEAEGTQPGRDLCLRGLDSSAPRKRKHDESSFDL